MLLHMAMQNIPSAVQLYFSGKRITKYLSLFQNNPTAVMTIEPQMEAHPKLFMPGGTAVAFLQVSATYSKTLPDLYWAKSHHRRIYILNPHLNWLFVSVLLGYFINIHAVELLWYLNIGTSKSLPQPFSNVISSRCFQWTFYPLLTRRLTNLKGLEILGSLQEHLISGQIEMRSECLAV